jgi:hypothetical protein
VSSEYNTGGSVKELLRRQAWQVRRRDRVRQASVLAVWPTALGSAAVLNSYGRPEGPDPLLSLLLLMLSWLILAGASVWCVARTLTPSLPPGPLSPRAARVGAWTAMVVAGLVAAVLAWTAPLAAGLWWATVAGAVMMLRARERLLDQQIQRLGHEAAVAAGYR